ncbi:MAG: hypothetical protein DWI21_10020 [Planctomycetota bacterium]|nr:MAG: hypothetical protein DWI21_10020 [Planctomycetota bacterium]
MNESLDSEDVVEIAELAESGTTWGTIIGRVLLAGLVVLLAIEAHGKFGYDRTLTTLRTNASKVMGEAIHGGQPELEEWTMPLAEAEKCVSGFPSKTRKTVLSSPIVVLKWFSLFKTYVIQLHLDDGDIVISLTTDDGE